MKAKWYKGMPTMSEGNIMYRILTEDKNRKEIYTILKSLHVAGFTVFNAIGSWQGAREHSLAIDLIDVPKQDVLTIAKTIKEWNRQESVLVLEIPVIATFI